MSDSIDWRYFFLPEDSSAAEGHRAALLPWRVGKTMLWTGIAVLLGLLLGHPA